MVFRGRGRLARDIRRIGDGIAGGGDVVLDWNREKCR